MRRLTFALMFLVGSYAQAAFQGFQPQVEYPVGVNPNDVVIGNFTGDAIVDIAVANSGDNTISVLPGNGDGTFQTQIVTSAGGVAGSPINLATGNFDGDGNNDLAVTDSATGELKIFLGNGDGTFQAPLSYATGSTPQGVIVGDFNGDNIQDVAVANIGSSTVGIFIGNGDGTFQPQVTYPTGGAGPVQLAAGDFSGNNILDLAVANLSDNTIAILKGNGDGTFQAPVLYPTNGFPNDITVGDFTGNGIISIAVADSGMGIFLGNGDGTFQPEVSYPSGTFPFGITAVDLDVDGTIDIALTDGSANNVAVYLGNGDGTFQTPTTYATGLNPASVVAGDLDGSGLPGLVTANFSGASVSVLLQNQTAPPEPVDVNGFQIQNRFLTQSEFANVITWSAPSSIPPPVAYRIYQDALLTQLLAEIPATQKLEYVQHNRVPGRTYTYYLVSVDGLGTESAPVVIVIP